MVDKNYYKYSSSSLLKLIIGVGGEVVVVVQDPIVDEF